MHNGSVFHPGSVVFPPALAVAQATGASGRDLLTAAVAGYEVGIRVGEFLGRSHYKVFHTTGTAGTVAAAAATGRLLNLSAEAMLHAFGSAGTQAAGLWEFLRDAADSKQLHTAKASADGLAAAYLARDGFTGAKRILEGAQGMAAGMSSDADPAPPRRRARHALGAGRDVVQVPRVVPAHPPGRRRAAAAGDRARPRPRTDRAGHGARAPGRDRRAGPGRRSADRPPGEVLDGHGARGDRGVPSRRPRRVRAALPRSRDRRAARARAHGARRRSRGRVSEAVDRQGRGRDDRRPHADRARRRAQGRPGQHALARRARRQGAAARRARERGDGGGSPRRRRARVLAGRLAARGAVARVREHAPSHDHPSEPDDHA